MQNLIIALTAAVGMLLQGDSIEPTPPDFEATLEIAGEPVPRLRFDDFTSWVGGPVGTVSVQTLEGVQDPRPRPFNWTVRRFECDLAQSLQLTVTVRTHELSGLQIPAGRGDLVSLVYRTFGVEHRLDATAASSLEGCDVASWQLDTIELLLLCKADWIFVACESNGIQRTRSLRFDLDPIDRGAIRWFLYHHAPAGKFVHDLVRLVESGDAIAWIVTSSRTGVGRLLELVQTSPRRAQSVGGQ